MLESTPANERRAVSFTVQSIDCIACTPVFRRRLGKVEGVLEVKELPITNKVVVVFDGVKLDRTAVEQEIRKTAQKAGLGGKLIFQR